MREGLWRSILGKPLLIGRIARVRGLLAIFSREIRSAFSTAHAYVLLASYALICGFFFFGLVKEFNLLLAQASVIPTIETSLNNFVIEPYYRALEVVLIFFIPPVDDEGDCG